MKLLPAVLLFLVLFSCGPGGAPVLQREDLFSLGLGALEDEMDLFLRPGVNSRDKNRFVLHDGRFFIVNGSSRKIMEFTSYGVLVTMHFNPETNPQPVALGLTSEDGELRNRKAVPYSFNAPGELALTRNKQLLVEDRVQEERRTWNEELGTIQDRVVLRFGADGAYRDFLGQEGVGGTPFPLIADLEVTASDEIVVVSRTGKGWAVWWFNRDATLLFHDTWTLDEIPLPADKEDVLTTCEGIVVDPAARQLYFNVSYYDQIKDPATGAHTGIDFYQNRLLFFDVDRKQFHDSLIVPRYFKKKFAPDGSEYQAEYPYGLVGMTAGRRFFFVTATDAGENRLLVIDDEGRSLSERTLQISEAEQELLLFHLSPSGVLSAMLCDGNVVKLVWWRSDRLVNLAHAPSFIPR